jgi:hypothetical protein
MRIAQVVLSGASQYERKCQRVDRVALAERHEVVTATLEDLAATGAQVAHIYASGELPAAPFVRFPLPYVSSVSPRKTRWRFRQPTLPRVLVTPFELPEAVEDRYFEAGRAEGSSNRVIGVFLRKPVRQMIEQTRARIERFRDDVTWRLFSDVPTPADLSAVDLWVDPATSEDDLDGFVAEALVTGLPVVAARTAINAARLEQGRTGLLVPPADPNEMTHAILSALFKPEVASNKAAAARQTVSKFKSRQRLRVLAQLYQTVIQ